MGGRAVKLKTKLTSSELQGLKQEIENSDYSKRRTLVAFIIIELCEGESTIDIAKKVTEVFDLRSSKNAFEATRATIVRVIKDLNEGLSVEDVIKKRGKGSVELEKWSDEKIITSIQKYHDELREQAKYTKLKEIDPGLIAVIENRMSFQEALRKSGVNPAIHLNDVDWGDSKNTETLLKEFLADIEYRCGRSSLNYHTMYAYQSAIIGTANDAHDKFSECQKHGCIKRVSGSAIVRKIENTFGDYKTGLQELLKINEGEYEESIQRKRHGVDISVYLEELRHFIEAEGDDWNISEFAVKCGTAHHGIHNHKEELSFFYDCHEDAMVAAFAQIQLEESGVSAEVFRLKHLRKLIAETQKRRLTNPEVRLEGYRFQKLFLEMLLDSGLIEGEDFFYEQEISRSECRNHGHTKICKVDFRFSNLIIDTKRTLGKSSRLNDQISRYLDHCQHLVVVTMRQKFKQEKRGEKTLTVLTISEFIDRSENLIGTKISNLWNDKFAEYGKLAAKRIQKGQ